MMLGDARRAPAKRAKRVRQVEPPQGFKLTDAQADWMAKWYPFQFLVMAGLYDENNGL
jgi:hypothetical protein